MRAIRSVVFLLVAVALVAAPVQAAPPTAMLPLLGTWSCTTKAISARDGRVSFLRETLTSGAASLRQTFESVADVGGPWTMNLDSACTRIARGAAPGPLPGASP